MVHRIEIGFKPGVRDAFGEKMKRKIVEHLGINVEEVKTIDIYTIEGDLTKENLERIAREPLSDPIIQTYVIDAGLADEFDWLIEVGFRPGVTDNVGKTARESIELFLDREGKNNIKVYTARQYLIKGVQEKRDAERIASGFLANDLIQHYLVVDRAGFDKTHGVEPYVPRVVEGNLPKTETISLEVDDDTLKMISSDRVLALTIDEMKIIQQYFQDELVIQKRKAVGLGGQITDVELECLAQTWSEHCKHKIFNSLIEYED